MSEPYPLPSYAASIWHTGDSIILCFPPREGEEKGHTIALALERCEVLRTPSGAVPANQSGWHVLLHILRERAARGRKGAIATRGEETQWQADRLMKGIVEAMSGARAEELRQKALEAERILAEAGIEI